MTVSTKELARLVDIVTNALQAHDKAVSAYDHKDYVAWRTAQDAADKALMATLTEKAGAVFTYRPAIEHRVRIAGISSTSTSSCAGAVHNWKRAAALLIAREG